MDVNKILQLLGNPGKYSSLLATCLCLTYFPVIFNNMAMTIYGATPPHRCVLPAGVNDTSAIPEGSSCTMYIDYDSNSNQTTSCRHGYYYELIEGESTVVNEWDLVCDNRWLMYAATSTYFVGVMFGGLIFGSLSDSFGRKSVVIITTVCYLILGIVVFFVENFVVFVLLRGLIGVMIQGLQMSTYVFAIELLGSQEHRVYFGGMFEVAWSLGIMILAAITYWLKDWRWIQLGITVPSVVGLMYIWFLPESIRWLISKERYNEALKVMKRAAYFNKVKLPDDIFKIERKDMADDNSRACSVLDIFRSGILCRRACAMGFAWFATAFGYYGLSMKASNLSGNKYMNYFISGAVELPAYLLGMFLFSRLGRKIPLISYFMIGGVACIISGVINNDTASTVLAWFGKFTMAGCWSVLFLYTSEIFPTVLRNVGVGACAFWARVASILSTLVSLLGDYTMDWVPILIFGIVALIGGFVTITLPETKDKTLADSLKDVETENLRHKNDSNEINNHTFDRLPVDGNRASFRYDISKF